jgi:alkylation response protein AidB-like acyl-CoA dehydrogenase
VDFELDDDQGAILDAVGSLLAQHAGAARAIQLAPKAGYDDALASALAEAGFRDVASGDGTGALEAVLVVESIARAAGVVSAGAEILVAPKIAGETLPGPVALAVAGESGPIRFGAHARTLLVSDGDEARIVPVAAGAATPVKSSFGYPMGRVAAPAGAGDSLGAGSGPRLRSWWRLALAAEAVGTMGAALDVTIDYVQRRRQFGRAIGSFQAVQHRLAQCAVAKEGSRWLCYEAAHHDAPAERAATAAAHATAAAARVFNETHQFSGAMGFTREHDLHVFSMRLWALRLELDGASGQRRALARSRWLGGS